MYAPAYVNLAANFILRFSVDSILRRESNPCLARQTFRHETRFIINRERKKKKKKRKRPIILIVVSLKNQFLNNYTHEGCSVLFLSPLPFSITKFSSRLLIIIRSRYFLLDFFGYSSALQNCRKASDNY